MYKIEFKTQEENKQIQELLFQLGFEWKYHNIGKNFHKTHENICYLYAQKDCITTGFRSPEGKEFFESHSSYCKKITLPQLRDLVVLKRNDVKDANCIDKKREAWYLASDGTYYAWQYRKLCWDTESDACVEAHDIKPINQPQDPTLISGADALRALADGKEVEGFLEENEEWIPIVYFSVQEVVNGLYKFRLKPELQKKIVNLTKPKHIAQDIITGEVCLVYEDNKVARDVCEYLREEFNLHGV